MSKGDDVKVSEDLIVACMRRTDAFLYEVTLDRACALAERLRQVLTLDELRRLKAAATSLREEIDSSWHEALEVEAARLGKPVTLLMNLAMFATDERRRPAYDRALEERIVRVADEDAGLDDRSKGE